jgi:hypothetical protein
MPQLTVESFPEKAFPGLIVDAHPHDTMSGYVDETDGIAPGLLVVRSSSGDFSAELPAAASALTTNVLGVAVHSHKGLAAAPGSSDNEVYEHEDVIPFLRHGRIWVQVENAVTPADPVHVRVATGAGGTVIGAFRTGADTATAVAWTAAKYLSSAGADGFAILEVNM